MITFTPDIMDFPEKYLLEFSSPEEALLCELDRETHRKTVHPQMISGSLQGKFLELIVRMLRPQRVLEIGTFTGYSALCMAAGLEEGATLDTIEADDELELIIRPFFDRSPHGGKIRLHTGSALRIAPLLSGTYDLVYIDGDKREYAAYYRMLMGDGTCRALVKSGSFLLADNILWYGKVAEPDKHTDPMTAGVVEFNRLVRNDLRVENVILPIRDGINLIRVK